MYLKSQPQDFFFLFVSAVDNAHPVHGVLLPLRAEVDLEPGLGGRAAPHLPDGAGAGRPPARAPRGLCRGHAHRLRGDL